MATRTFNTVLYNGTDADFRAWAQGLVDTLKGMTSAIIQTSDTGQLADPVVATRPAAGAAAGYLIFRTNDSMHSANPVYFKIEFGSASGGQIIPTMWLTVGSGTDGAGTITGIRIARAQLSRNSSGAANGAVYEHAAAWGDGWFWIWQGINLGYGSNFGWERNRDSAGAVKDDASHLWFETSNTFGLYWAIIPKSPTAATAFSSTSSGPGLPVLFSTQNSGGEYSNLFGEVPVFPVEPFLGRRQPPLLSICVVSGADVGSGVVIQTTMYGATKQFRRISDTSGKWVRGASNAYAGATGNAPALCGRWE